MLSTYLNRQQQVNIIILLNKIPSEKDILHSKQKHQATAEYHQIVIIFHTDLLRMYKTLNIRYNF